MSIHAFHHARERAHAVDVASFAMHGKFTAVKISKSFLDRSTFATHGKRGREQGSNFFVADQIIQPRAQNAGADSILFGKSGAIHRVKRCKIYFVTNMRAHAFLNRIRSIQPRPRLSSGNKSNALEQALGV